MNPSTMLIGMFGLGYNTMMDSLFGNYRFSHTIEQANDGEPGWLKYLHDEHREFYDSFGFTYPTGGF